MANEGITEITPEAKLNLAIKTLQGVKETHRAEICGLWLWVEFPDGKPSDSTRTLLKEAKFRWAPRKKKWYFPAVKARGRGASMSYIRRKYGSEELEAV